MPAVVVGALNCLRVSWSVILTILRMIFFLLSLVIVLNSIIAIFIILNTDRNILMLPFLRESTSLLPELFKCCFFLYLGLLGCYGSFYKHQTSLKLFAALSFISSAIIVLVILCSMTPTKFDELNKKLEIDMDELARKYDWFQEKQSDLHNPVRDSRNASQVWDELQVRMDCCGWHDFRDWFKYRPPSIPNGRLPASCCRPKILKEECLISNTEKSGCLGQIQSLEYFSLFAYIISAGFIFLLFLISFILNHLNCHKNFADASAQPMEPIQSNPNEYKRFLSSKPDDSVDNVRGLLSYTDKYDVESNNKNSLGQQDPPSYSM